MSWECLMWTYKLTRSVTVLTEDQSSLNNKKKKKLSTEFTTLPDGFHHFYSFL